ncbi:glycosyltransferase family 2 protein [Primorskyibacter sp. S187A]|uniref:glycosyltransferase family 2 protein n=1 Tax=Primorskyibacter sp. S187A TaxID=3415130 RepID=UPI003C7D7C2A
MSSGPALSIIIPAHNEAATLPGCLSALYASVGLEHAQVIVVANGCSDETTLRARERAQVFEARGWWLDIIELKEGDKLAALDAADAIVQAPVRAYLDADVVVDPAVMGQLARVLNRAEPAYASGKLRIAAADTAISRAYARIYARVPFLTHGVPGAGLFAMNAAGRARWDNWPRIISDDTFARLNFAPKERLSVPAGYVWPLVEGWQALVKVRRRQNRGVEEIREQFPELLQNDDKPAFPMGQKLSMALSDPTGFAIYTSVALATKFGRTTTWERGR